MMGAAHFAILLLVATMVHVSMPATVQANTLVADLSLDEVAITTDFNGENLLLFGAVEDALNDDIIVEFKGPALSLASRKKEQVSGIWVNTQTIEWKNAPSFYHIFSTRSLDEILDQATQEKLNLGYKNIGLKAANINLEEADRTIWIESLSRNMREKGLWQRHDDAVSIIRGVLFRAPVALPANILPGDYDVRVIHIRDGQLLAEDRTSIAVAKQGLGAYIYQLAHEYSVFYGLFAVLFAVLSGWLAAVAFRKT